MKRLKKVLRIASDKDKVVSDIFYIHVYVDIYIATAYVPRSRVCRQRVKT